MGRKISKSQFTPDDFRRFHDAITRQADLVVERLRTCPNWATDERSLGDETEFAGCRLDLGTPFLGTHVVASHADPRWEIELGAWNAEHGSPVVLQRGNAYSQLSNRLTSDVADFSARLEPYHAGLAACGVLPSLRRHHTRPEYLDGSPRYQALARELSGRYGPIELNLPNLQSGQPPLHYTDRGVGLEAFTTGRQSHVSTSTATAIDWYNASVWVATIIIGLQGFSPFLFGRHVSNGDVRGQVFAAAVRHRGRGLGSTWLTSLEGLIKEALAEPILLPEMSGRPDEELQELTLHLGSLWPLIRLVLSDTGLRWENRYLPSMPIPDMIAGDAAAHGLTRLVAGRWVQQWTSLPDSFAVANSNFEAARDGGAQAEIWWPDGRGGFRQTTPAAMLLELAPAAIETLDQRSITDGASAMEPILARAAVGRNGSSVLIELANRLPRRGRMEQLSLQMVHGINTPVLDWLAA